jgi:hypothetical protein
MLALQLGDLVAQHEDLAVLIVIAARQQPQQRGPVCHAEVAAPVQRRHGRRA